MTHEEVLKIANDILNRDDAVVKLGNIDDMFDFAYLLGQKHFIKEQLELLEESSNLVTTCTGNVPHKTMDTSQIQIL